MVLEIRKVGVEDVTLLRDFLGRAGNSLKTFRYFNKRDVSCLENHLLTVMGVGDDGKPLAYGHLDREDGVTWLGICVVESATGRGFGREIMAKLLARADEDGIRLDLAVDKGNSRAISLYEKCGFKFRKEMDGLLFYARERAIPVYKPWVPEKSKEYVAEALESGWISSAGKFVKEFEERLAAFVGAKYAIVTNSGTGACHLILEALGVSERKRVLCPALTFIATANTAVHCHKDPSLVRFVDADPETWNMDLNKLEDAAKEGPGGDSVLFWTPVYGNMSDMDQVEDICSKYGITLCEDACEAIGSKWKGRFAGTFGVAGAFSFHAAKSVATGEGGAVVTNDKEIYDRIWLLRGHGQANKEYYHPVVGYNYRMTNIQAAIGVGQMEEIQHILDTKDRIYKRYKRNLEGRVRFASEPVGATHSHWAVTVLAAAWDEKSLFTEMRDAIRKALADNGIETRGVFIPIPSLPPYARNNAGYPVATMINRLGVSLPTFVGLRDEEIDRICDIVKSVADKGV